MRTARPGEINGDWVDRYTLAHYSSGVLAGAARLPWWATLSIAIGWEILERGLKDRIPAVFPSATQDTLPNAIGDIIAMMLGWGTFRLLPAPPPATMAP